VIAIIRLSAVLLAGPRYWLLPLLPIAWLAVQAMLLVAGRLATFEPAAAQNTLIGVPVAVLATILGSRIIAGELDQRTLEIAYTVPGGAHRVWLGKLAAASLILLASLSLTALLTFAFFTSFPVIQTLYGAAQGAVFCMAMTMGFATLLRSEASGALATIGLIGLATRFRIFIPIPPRISPFWNPLRQPGADADHLFAMALQNRIGIALAIAAIVALTFARAERRETMLSR
jgi:ABC-type transport system involved in multi-copper enzyme maturation permease subunit